MAGVNKVILVGNVGQRPELKYTAEGVPFCNFSVATNERVGGGEGEKKEHTEWHRCTAWRKLADICAQYLDKGKQVYIEGKIRTRQWVTQDGEKRYSTEVIVNEMVMLGGGKGQSRDDDDEETYTAPAQRADQARGAGGFSREGVAAGPAKAQPPDVIDLSKLNDREFF